MGYQALRTIFDMVCAINKDCKSTDPVVIFDYSGHTQGVYVSIYENGYTHHEDENKTYQFYCDDKLFNKDDYLEIVDALQEIMPEIPE